jgi:hypothetical protein
MSSRNTTSDDRRRPTVRTEFSALGRRKGHSALLPALIKAVFDLRCERGFAAPEHVADFGCGQLRNLTILHKNFPRLCMVDTEFQLNRPHSFGGRMMTVREYVLRHYSEDSVYVMSDQEFSSSTCRFDVIFSINVMDVVPAPARESILDAISGHIASTGQFASLVPRNDSRTLQLCKQARPYKDGHIFPNHGAFTFYKNWPGNVLADLYKSRRLDVLLDLSLYRHSCLICMKKQEAKKLRSRHLRRGLMARKQIRTTLR